MTARAPSVFLCPACGEPAPLPTRFDEDPAPCGCGVANGLTVGGAVRTVGIGTPGIPVLDWRARETERARADRAKLEAEQEKRATTLCHACGQTLPDDQRTARAARRAPAPKK